MPSIGWITADVDFHQYASQTEATLMDVRKVW